ncbi:MAG: 2-succinyl-6-hydroxy-2,4-cyclohexadiene-1-carboxy late synthase [Anaerolineales bacterium]
MFNPRFVTLGNLKSPPLVFLHGFLGRGEGWFEIARPLSERYHCILPDLPGHGESAKDDLSLPLNFDVVTDWLFRLLDEIPAPKIHLAGYSLGGRIALAFACRFPERILTLTLESANPGIADRAERARRLTEDTLRAEAILKDGMLAFVEQWYQMPLFASLHNHPQRISAIRESASRNDPRWMAKVIRELSPGAQPPLWDLLSKLSVPVFLITGEKDTKYVRIVRSMAKQIRGAHFRIVPKAGHNVHVEQPEEYIALLKKFLQNSTAG